MSVNIVICDDKQDIREDYTKKLHVLGKTHDISVNVQSYSSGQSLLFDFEDSSHEIDLVFMDMHMPGIEGHEVAKELRDMGYQNEIIFLTVSEEHFLDAFDVSALHYVVKGKTSPEYFEAIFLRAVEVMEKKKQEYVLFSAGGETRNISVKSIRYFDVQKKIITVHYDEESFEFYSTLSKLESQLEKSGFFRMHKSYLVSLSYIEKITSTDVILNTGEILPLSRRNYPVLKDILENHFVEYV